MCESDNSTVLASALVSTSNFTDASTPHVFTIVFNQIYWSNQPLSFRITKRGGHGLIFTQATVCAATDGSPCAAQIEDSCPSVGPSPAPSTPAPSTECSTVGGCCLYAPCCDGSTCVDFGLYQLCVNHLCLPSNSTPAPSPPAIRTVGAHISTVFPFTFDFWQANQYNLAQEYLYGVRAAVIPFFAGAKFGPVTYKAGSVVVDIEWTNVPASVLNNPTLLNGFLPSGCFNYPSSFLLSQVLAVHYCYLYEFFLF